MRRIKSYRIWEQEGNLTPAQVEFLNRYVEGSWQVNGEGLVDVEGNFSCLGKGLTSLGGVRFGRVTEYFSCSHNLLTSLEGGPREVRGNFSCDYNQLTSLEGAPREVEGDFRCQENHLTSLEGAPREVGGDFLCHNNRLTSLEGAPREVGGDFSCYDNQLTSLEGGPEKVGGDFYCHVNLLTSLEGGPVKVRDFLCSKNPISQQTLEMIHSKMRETPGMPYGGVLVALQGKISPEDWERLDKSAIDRLSDKTRKGYKLLGGLGAI